jgi:hypothetical protein
MNNTVNHTDESQTVSKIHIPSDVTGEFTPYPSAAWRCVCS